MSITKRGVAIQDVPPVLSDYVLVVAKSKLEDTLKPRAELLEKKPDAKK
jgi:hypothetical protein